MSTHAIYPGTFDPITLGHIDIIKRAMSLFSTVTVAIATSERKKPLFSIEQRLELAQSALKHLPTINVISFDTLLVDLAQKHGCNIILRGVRGTDDWEYEKQLAYMNKKLNGSIETVFMLPSAELQHISSTLVKDIAKHQGDTSSFVPKIVSDLIKIKY